MSASRQTRFSAHGRLDFERFCRLKDWLSFGANRRRRFGAYSWLDLRFYTLEDRLNFGVGRQRHLRGGGWFDFERFCTLEDWLNFDANRRMHFRVCGWLDFAAFDERGEAPLPSLPLAGLQAVLHVRGSAGRR